MARDTVGRTVGVALGVCLVCSVLVAVAAVSLRPIQAANRLLDRKRNILVAAGLLGGGGSVDELYRRIEPRLVDLSSGAYVEGMDPEAFDQRRAARDPQTSTAVPAAEDIASIKRRANLAPVYLVRQGDRVEKVILPIQGLGLWSTLYGFIALRADDLDTVAGLVFYEHGETPGLGGEVDNPQWQALWPGKKVYGDHGEVRIEVIKGNVNPDRPEARYQVDGLSGATLTSRGVDQMLKYWLGESGFEPYLARLRQQGG